MRFGKAPRPTGVVLSANVGVPPQVTSELSRVVQPRGAGEPMKHRTLKIETINLRVVARVEAARKIGEKNGTRDAKANRQKHYAQGAAVAFTPRIWRARQDQGS